jgi:phosphatidylethanolamine-binding protein (PEBP) family uncharacterized protein
VISFSRLILGLAAPDATVFAVKTDKLDVKADTSAAVVGFNLHFNTLARAEIMGLFKR